jgi:galactosyl transferase GMA12/MNN10 family
MYAVASINTEDYQDLADLTDAPKQEYCDRYGYKFFVLKETKYSPIMGFNKIHYVLDLFKQYPEIEWLLFSECDAMITNLTITMEDKIDNDYHFIVPVDRLNINSGNFLARNSEQGRAYLQMIIDKETEYAKVEWAEQQVIIDTLEEYANTVKIVPQREMNSYEQHVYDYCDIRIDVLGTSGEWQPGDWIVHWPGTYKPARIQRAQALSQLIVR